MLDGAVEAARLVDNPQDLVWTLFNSAYAWLASGDVEVAFARAAESWELAQSLDPGPVSAHAGCAFSSALLETGEAERAAELFVESAGGDELRMIGGAWRGRCLMMLTRARLAAGRRADAERSAAAAQACADEVELPMGYAMAELAQGRDRALTTGTARARAAAQPPPPRRSRASATATTPRTRGFSPAGRSRSRERRSSAAAELERAVEAFREAGAGRYQAAAEQELRKLGRSVYHRSAAGTATGGIAALTQRELQLARLVVDRKTNPQIAAELFLSQKTVETHLRNIFRKVGVSSRVELARAVEQADRAAHEPA